MKLGISRMGATVRMLLQAPLLALLLLGLVSSCEASRPPSSSEQDGLVVRVRSYVDPLEIVAPFHLAPTPAYRSGWRTDDHPFSRVHDGRLLSGGGAVILDANQLIFLTADGAGEATVAGPGPGPGEFRSALSMHLIPPDTLIVGDAGGKFTVVAGHDIAWEISASTSALASHRPIGTVHGLKVVLGRPLIRPARVEESWSQAPLIVLHLETGHADTVAFYDYHDLEVDRENPFHGGFGAATVTDSSVVVGRGDRAELTWLDLQGQIRQVVRWQAPARPVTDSFLAEFEAAFLEINGVEDPVIRSTPEQHGALLARFKAAARGPLPVFNVEGLIGDDRGNIWISEFSADYRFPRRYHVVSAAGEWIGQVIMPSRFQILDIRDDLVLGIETDSLGVIAVAVYPLLRRVQ